MYDVYKRSLENLNFKASHDELTGAYNRSGYELLLSSIDLNSTYMMLFDVDDFKHINDNYGHETGDEVLARLVQVLRSHFRSDDYICRIGGDEFVVFMVHSTENQRDLVEAKIEKINNELAQPVNGLPPVSVSVGITHGSKVSDAKSLFERTDEAMYQAKQSGKNTFAYYQQ
jgi:diguanylate cyclase (GGDEF)-like protein